MIFGAEIQNGDLALIIVSVITSFVASSGFWAWMSKRSDNKDASVKLIMGLAYDKALELGLKYIDRGYVTRDELEDYRKYLYEPYKELGGNGVVERIMHEVMELPIVRSVYDLKSEDRRVKRDPRSE